MNDPGLLNWCVLYTMPNMEKKLRDELDKRGFEVFLPLYKAVRQWSDRKKRVMLPLFPGYLFIRTLLNKRSEVLGVAGVVRYLTTGGRCDIISPDHIELIKNMLDHSPVIVKNLPEHGELVTIVDGPFRGLAAVVEYVSGRCRVSLRVESVSKIVTIDISADCIQKTRELAPLASV